MADGAFEKDFGYLMPFLDKVAAQTVSLADPAARQELARLMAGERERWMRIRELLSGSAGRPAAATQGPAAQSVPTGGEPTARQFTVGSLRDKK
ncbi:MAG TPA: hypothetical protein VNO14_02710 [Blastocatellia bacterium]|nr:hypothetical protein [Blastocatellia bacterium]